MNDLLKLKIEKLPTCPGCYLMKSEGRIIYVGKAVNLKNRVSQYFTHSKAHTVKVRAMVARIDDFDIVLCDTNLEALILECNLIKLHKPQYNILLKDDKHYPYLKIDLAQDYPRVELVRRVEKDKAKYFGPYMGATGVREVLDVLRGLFPLRTCAMAIKPGMHQRPCLHHQLGECLAPCASLTTPEEYGRVVQEVVDFLSGKSAAVIDRLTEQMNKAAREMRALSPAVKQLLPGNTLYLRLPSDSAIGMVQPILQRFSGRKPVVLYIESTGAKLRAPQNLFVSPTQELVDTLSDMLGAKNVVLK